MDVGELIDEVIRREGGYSNHPVDRGGAISRLLNDPRFEVVGILVRQPKKARDIECPADLFLSSAADLLARKPDVVLEALSNGAAGHALIRAALEAGCDVASANKQAVAADFQ